MQNTLLDQLIFSMTTSTVDTEAVVEKGHSRDNAADMPQYSHLSTAQLALECRISFHDKIEFDFAT